MKWRLVAGLIFSCALASAQNSFLGFDSNDYPGDARLKILKKSFSYAGYWLNHPPGESSNSWAGHRAAIESAGFGFLVLFNGRLYDQLKTVANAQRLGKSDASAAAATAHREGFPAKTILFLDQEQGGRMLPEQKAYIYAWVDGVVAGGFRAGIYCSGIPANDDSQVVTAADIRQHAAEVAPGQNADRSARAPRDITYWVFNDACPPAPGCALSQRPPDPAKSGVNFAEVWQFAQSPQRKDVAGRCTNYSRDGNCYSPGLNDFPLDVNVATSPDPSHARR